MGINVRCGCGKQIGVADVMEDTDTGEIVAEIETNGWTIGGLADARKATNQMRITGREKDGKVSAEMDGRPLLRNW